MFFECWHVWIGGSLEDLVLLPDEVGVQEALFLESDPVALAAADTGEGNQSNCYLVVLMIVGSQFESLERPAGTACRQPKWIPHQSYECMYAHYQLYLSGKSDEEQPASYRTLGRVVSSKLSTTWSKLIRIRKQSQHARFAT